MVAATVAVYNVGTTVHPASQLGTVESDLIDGTLTKDYSPAGPSIDVVITCAAAVAITGYRVGASARYAAANSPKAWTLQGSNDGTNWTTLDARPTQPAFTTSETRTYAVTRTSPYVYYRFKGLSTTTSNYLWVGELTLLLAPLSPAAAWSTGPDDSRPNASDGAGGNTEPGPYGAEKTIDGDTSTRYVANAPDGWVVWDFTAPATVETASFTLPASAPTWSTVDVATSDDGAVWAQPVRVAPTWSGATGVVTVPSPTSARYIRIGKAIPSGAWSITEATFNGSGGAGVTNLSFSGWGIPL